MTLPHLRRGLFAALALSLLGSVALAQSTSTITALPAVSSLDGTEVMPADQGSGTVITKKTTLTGLADFVEGRTSLNTKIDNRAKAVVGGQLAAGTNVTVTCTGSPAVCTIASSGGGGGGGPSPHVDTVNPTAAADTGAGYVVGQLWVTTGTGNVFVARSVASGVAAWTKLSLRPSAPYTTGTWYPPVRSTIGATAVVADTLYGSLFEVRERTTIQAVGTRVTALVSSTAAKVGIYTTTNGVCDAKLVEIGSPLSTAAVANVSAALATNLTVEPGLYCMVSLFNGAPSVSTVSGADQGVTERIGGSSVGAVLNTASQSAGYTGTGQTYTGGLPSSFGTATVSASAVPVFAFQIQ